jgi:N-acyl-D-amino-acid deacylase
MAAQYSLVLRNGTVIDGTRAPRFKADVAVRDGRIAAIGKLSGARADTEIDAAGKIVAPGFIDAHTHDDRLMLSAPDMAPKVSQGVTTVVAGNCGISLAPAPRGMRPPVPPLDLLDDEGAWFRFKSFKEYVAALREAPAATNCALLVGHSMLRVQTMDNVERRPARRKSAECRSGSMKRSPRARSASPPGFTTSPRSAASTEEVIEVCRPLVAATAFTARTCATRATTCSTRWRRPSASAARSACRS